MFEDFVGLSEYYTYYAAMTTVFRGDMFGVKCAPMTSIRRLRYSRASPV